MLPFTPIDLVFTVAAVAALIALALAVYLLARSQSPGRRARPLAAIERDKVAATPRRSGASPR